MVEFLDLLVSQETSGITKTPALRNSLTFQPAIGLLGGPPICRSKLWGLRMVYRFRYPRTCGS
jgi:hypothetical protein